MGVWNFSMHGTSDLLARLVGPVAKLRRTEAFAGGARRPPARRFHAYCVGTPKSGTHSIAKIFGGGYRAAHEAAYEDVIGMISAAADGSAGRDQLADFIRSRDLSLNLEMEASHLLVYFLDILLAEFEEARFILTIRDCYSWLDSQINNQLAYIEADHWKDFGELKYRHEALLHPKEERVLAEFGLYTLDGYLSAWADHNRQVLTTVPPHKLLVVRTREISRDLQKIADFIGVPADSLNVGGTHSFKARRKFGLLSRLDEQYLEEKVNQHCRSLMDAYFPEVKNFRASHAPRTPEGKESHRHD
jgi:hypothetical protein